jgi:hypothetical protein
MQAAHGWQENLKLAAVSSSCAPVMYACLRMIYTCLSPAARSETGAICCSQDQGAGWRPFLHSVTSRATMMSVALHPRDPSQVYGVSRCGQVFGTQDGGATRHEFLMPEACGDVYTLQSQSASAL